MSADDPMVRLEAEIPVGIDPAELPQLVPGRWRQEFPVHPNQALPMVVEATVLESDPTAVEFRVVDSFGVPVGLVLRMRYVGPVSVPTRPS